MEEQIRREKEKGAPRKKKQRREEEEEAKSKAESSAPLASSVRVVGGSGRAPRRGNWRHDHGGFRQSRSLQYEDTARLYRDATPALSHSMGAMGADASFSSAVSTTTSTIFDPAAFMAGICSLGQQVLGRQPAMPVASSSPVASTSRGHGSGGGSRGGILAYQDGQRRGQQQQRFHHDQQQAAPEASSSYRGGQRGAAAPRR